MHFSASWAIFGPCSESTHVGVDGTIARGIVVLAIASWRGVVLSLRLILSQNTAQEGDGSSWYRPRIREILGKFSIVLCVSLAVAVAPVLSFGVWQKHPAGGAFVTASVLAQEGDETGDLLSVALLAPPSSGGVLGGPAISVVDGMALAAEGSTGSDVLASDIPASDRIALYIVREGDTLSQIAEMFGVSVNTIRWANNLTSADLITPGQELLILPVSGVRYTIKKGDTLESVAKALHGDVREIITYNGLKEGEPLRPGSTIVVPGGELPEVHSPTPRKAPTPARKVASGYFIHPVPGAVRSQGLHGWNAVDLAAPIGTPILASASGKVLVARPSGWNGGYGAYIVIRHNNGTQTLYSHLSKVAVYVGQNVVQGQVIGYVGSTGRSTGPHLHFEVRGAANPFAY
ncbi:MAG: hypothetical protein KatS3mg099_230 [Candidatus Parcubacteria bacterium]|nr:MAG: hypothetical protein KatS3mg099_230 [Candidatus Parcubacteria bacterium]